MKKFILPAMLFLAVFSACSQDSEKVKNIKKLLELTGSGKIGVQAMQNMLNTFKSSFPSVDEKFWDDFSNEVKAEDLDALVIPIYDKYYTDSDIKQLIEFYNSPVGRKMTEKMPVILQESMEAGKEWGKQIAEKVLTRLKEKGYYKEE